MSGDTSLKSRKSALLDKPDIVIGTPSKVVAHIEAGNMDLTESLKMLVVDEADLVFSYGYQDDVVNLLAKLPAIRQNMLMSATLGSEVDALKKLVLRRPVVLKLEESDLPDERQLLQVGQQPTSRLASASRCSCHVRSFSVSRLQGPAWDTVKTHVVAGAPKSPSLQLDLTPLLSVSVSVSVCLPVFLSLCLSAAYDQVHPRRPVPDHLCTAEAPAAPG